MRVMMMMMMMMMMTIIIIANFRLNYKCNVKYEYDFKTNQVTRTLTFPCWWPAQRDVREQIGLSIDYMNLGHVNLVW